MNNANDWHDKADAYLRYFEDKAERISSAQVFPHLLTQLGDLKGQRVLDFGCGQGRFSRALAAAGAQVSAFDASEAEIANARALDQGQGIDYLEDAAALGASGPFDRILCFMVLLCNPAPAADALLQQLYSLTAPGGLLALANTDTATLGRRFADFYSTPPDIPERGAAYQSYIPTSAGTIEVTDHYYSPEHLRSMLSHAGFSLDTEARVAEPFITHVARRP